MSEPTVELLDKSAFTANEERLAAEIRDAGTNADSTKAVGIALAGAFLLYRLYMWRRLKEETAVNVPDPKTLWELNGRLFAQFGTRFAATAVPSLISGYRQGLIEARTMPMSEDWLEVTANAYARQLGSHLNDTSGQALIEGYQAQLNRRIAARAALDRTIDAFGVTPRSMKTLVNVWTGTPQSLGATAQPLPNTVKGRADSIIAKSIAKRAQEVGESESVSAKNQAKSLIWLYLQQQGQLPADATKMWKTAKDERVCPYCGPMHKVQVPLNEQFTLTDGTKVWAPSLHPRCRCDIVLRGANQISEVENFLVEEEPRVLVAKSAWGVVDKAVGRDSFDRDSHGRFATTESRRVQYKEPEPMIDPRVAALMQSIQGESVRAETASRPAISREQIAQAIKMQSLKRESLKSESLGRETLSRETIGKPVMAAKETLDKPRVGSPNAKQKMHNERVKLSVETLANKKMDLGPAERAPLSGKKAQPDDPWTGTPDGKPMYGIFNPIGNPDDAEMLWADDEVEWYTSGEGGRGVPSMQQGIDNYWKTNVLSEHALMQEFEDDCRDLGVVEDYDGQSNIVLATEDGEMYIPFDIYEQAWKASVYGMSKLETPLVVVHTVTVELNQQSPDPDDWEYEYMGEEDMAVPLYDIARDLNIHSRVRDLRPVVAKADKIMKDADGTWGGIMSNPGKWRVTFRHSGPSDEWAGRDSSDPFPYRVVSVEPEDR